MQRLETYQKQQTYQAYIPTHFREFILSCNAKQKLNREAELEDAIINCYYRRVDSLIAEGILSETTHHFNCRENDSSPHCNVITSRCKYTFIGQDTTLQPLHASRKMLKCDAPTTGDLVLQMVGRYGNMKMLDRIEPSLISMRGTNRYREQCFEAGKFALGRDEIELYSSIWRDCYVNNCYNVAYLNSVTGIKEYTRSVLCHKEPFEADYTVFEPLYARRRLDLMEALDPYMEQYWSVGDALKNGFIELLEKFYAYAPGRIPACFETRSLTGSLFGHNNSKAKVRLLGWLKEKNIPINPIWVLETQDVLTLEWFLTNGYTLTPENLAGFTAGMELTMTLCGYSSAGYSAWKVNLLRVREFGILENALRAVNTIEFNHARACGYVCPDLETLHASERDRLAKIRVVTC